MLAKRREINLEMSQVFDALLLGGVFWFAHFLRYHRLVILDSLWAIEGFDRFFWFMVMIVLLGSAMLDAQGFYAHPMEKTPWKSLKQIAGAGMWLGLIVGLSVIFLRFEIPSRSVLILFGMMAPPALLAREWVVREFALYRLRNGASGESIILAGEPESMQAIQDSFTPMQRLEIRVVEVVDLQSGSVETLVAALRRHSVGRVVLAFKWIEMDKVQHAVEACETEGVEAWLSADFIHIAIARPTFEWLAQRPMLVFRVTPGLSWAMVLKNLVDRMAACSGLLVLSPLFLLVAIAIKRTSAGPVIFRQQRAGLHGMPFEIWKFRTMSVDAEEKRTALLGRNVMQGPVFKVEDDPRITRVGHWLRRTSLDELPQLVNVLRGEMSLVGPRPLPVYEVKNFEKAAHRRRLSMKPGITCLWQVRGRNRVTDFQDWVRMDLEYIDSWSVFLDIYILACTVPAVLFGRGAK